MFLKNLLTKIGTFFIGLFNEAQAVWSQIEPELQKAITDASTVLALISNNLTAVPSDVWALIEEKLPGISQTTVTAAIIKINNTLNTANTIAVDSNFEDALIALQTYLAGLGSGNIFIIIIKAAVTLAVDIFAPASTSGETVGEVAIQKVELVLEWVYQTIVKPLVAPKEVTVDNPVAEVPVVDINEAEEDKEK